MFEELIGILLNNLFFKTILLKKKCFKTIKENNLLSRKHSFQRGFIYLYIYIQNSIKKRYY
jgi:hypothetical protein